MPALAMQPVGNAVGLQSVEAFKVQEGDRERLASRIALLYCNQIGSNSFSNCRIFSESAQDDLAKR